MSITKKDNMKDDLKRAMENLGTIAKVAKQSTKAYPELESKDLSIHQMTKKGAVTIK